MILYYIILYYITLHYITLHYITLHYITLHYITLHYITLHYIYIYITLHYITLLFIILISFQWYYCLYSGEFVLFWFRQATSYVSELQLWRFDRSWNCGSCFGRSEQNISCALSCDDREFKRSVCRNYFHHFLFLLQRSQPLTSCCNLHNLLSVLSQPPVFSTSISAVYVVSTEKRFILRHSFFGPRTQLSCYFDWSPL